MKTNYILIDYENVQPTTLAILDQAHFRVIVFVGASQTKISFDVASALQTMGARAEYVKIAGNGPNALDFHIAFYIGFLASREPDACFNIISNDTGFDPLVQHLISKKVRVYRSREVSDIPVVKAAQATSPAEQLAVIVSNLQQRGASKPRTVTTLTGTIRALFQQKLTDEAIAALMQKLQAHGIVTVQDTKVTYTFPA